MDSEKRKIKLTPTAARKRLENYCAYQERCHSEVRERLFNFGLHTNEVDQIVAYLITENYLNEERFAEAYVSGKIRIKHWGKNKIKMMLKQKKVSDYSINKALREFDGDEYYEILKKTAKKKAATIKLPKVGVSKEQQQYQKKYKLVSYLLSRGFENDLVKEVVSELVN